jgi:SAM-dependent methyltransferase
MNKRNNLIFKHLDRNGNGLEVGPSHSPIAPKKEGYRVHVIDHLNKDQLIEKYRGHGVNLENIEDVDFVWKGESFLELTRNAKHYDWIIASHVIEHVPDLIRFLLSCDDVLKDGGMLSLVIPDKRFCFDHFRSLTSISKIIDNFIENRIVSSPGTMVDYHLNVVSNNNQISWSQYSEKKFKTIHSVRDALLIMQKVLDTNVYIDCHESVFVPSSFRLMIQDLFDLGFIPFREVDFSETEGFEFYITLSRIGKGLVTERIKMLNKIHSEVSQKPSFWDYTWLRLKIIVRWLIDAWHKKKSV